jgi:hypothetical protein
VILLGQEETYKSQNEKKNGPEYYQLSPSKKPKNCVARIDKQWHTPQRKVHFLSPATGKKEKWNTKWISLVSVSQEHKFTRCLTKGVLLEP